MINPSKSKFCWWTVLVLVIWNSLVLTLLRINIHNINISQSFVYLLFVSQTYCLMFDSILFYATSKEFTVDQVVEYQWPLEKGGESLMIQEQISEYLGVKSFKRKYPDLKRRVVEAEEKTYLREKGLVIEAMCDLGNYIFVFVIRISEFILLMLYWHWTYVQALYCYS